MNLVLTRKDFRRDGIFGVLTDEHSNLIAHTLERAYGGDNGLQAKVAPGRYDCERHPPHRLPYETFILRSVPDFEGQPVEGVLIHCGNSQKDTDGCILVGEKVIEYKGAQVLTNSRAAFAALMELQKGVEGFALSIVGPA